jgi:hypothetical protein
VSWLAAVAVTALVAVPAHAQPDYYFDHVHVTLDGGASPFAAVVYSVRDLGGVAAAMQAKSYPFVDTYDNRAALVEPSDFAALADELASLGILELPDAAARFPFALTWKVEVGLRGKAHAFTVTGPDLLPDARYARIVDLVQRFVMARTGPAYYRDLAVPGRDVGILNLHTYPPADVELDGVPLGRRTPLQSFEIAPGPHVAGLFVPEKGIRKKIKFDIKKSDITTLNFRLESPKSEPVPEPVP